MGPSAEPALFGSRKYCRSTRVFAASGFALLCLVEFAGSAAAVNLPGAVEPGRDRPSPVLPTQPPDVEFRLETPQRSPVPRAADVVHFRLNDIKVVGASVFAADSFRALYESLIGKDVTLANILDVADAIEAQYRKAGYLLVRAYVPPQRVKDGVFTIDVVEGFVATTSVEGTSEETQAITKSYLADTVGQKPLQLSTIERALLLANDIPGVTASGTLRASPSTPGASDLIVSEAAPWIAGGIAADNRGSRFSGLWTLKAHVAFNDLLGADQLGLAANTSPDGKEQVSVQANYRKAIGPDGLIGGLFGVYTHGEPGSTLAVAGVLTNSWAAGGRLTYPLIRSRAVSVLLQGGLTAQQATIHTLGVAVSHDQWRVLDIGVTAVGNNLFGAGWSGTLDLSQGLPIFGATPANSPTISKPGAKLDFTKLEASAQIVRPIVLPFSVAVGGSGQFSFVHLLTGEEVSYGGTQVVRGFDPGSITGDRGIGGFVELRCDSHLPQWHINTIEPYLFLAGASAWYVHAAAHGLADQSIASAGGGVRFWFPFNIYAGAEVLRMLNSVPGSDAGHQATKVLIDAAIDF